MLAGARSRPDAGSCRPTASCTRSRPPRWTWWRLPQQARPRGAAAQAL